MSKSFSFRLDGSRVYDSAESADSAGSAPAYFAYGLHASLYAKFRDTTWLSGAITRLRHFDQPGIFSAPETLLVSQDPVDNVITFHTAYNHFLHGPRCVLADAEAHMEWKKRKDKNYTTREHLLTKEALIKYAADGRVPPMLKAAPIHPEPVSVVVDLSGHEIVPGNLRFMTRQMFNAHRKHRLYVKSVISDDTRWYIDLNLLPTRRGDIKLFKLCCRQLADADPGGARGCVESELRQRLMLEDGSYALNKCPYSVRKAAYTANRSAILEHRRKTIRSTVSDERESWNTKIKWACDFQKAKRGISLYPPKISKSKKRKWKTTAASEPEKTRIQYGRHRGGVANASEENLQIPQIQLVESSSFMPQPCDVVVMSAELYMRHFKAFIEDQKAFESYASKVIVLDPQNVLRDKLSWLSWASLLNARIVSNPIEIKHLYLLLQWLPLWWDEDKHVAPSKAKRYPKMSERLRNVVQNMPQAPGTDEYGETEPDTRPEWMIHLAKGAEHMPLFATACRLKDE